MMDDNEITLRTRASLAEPKAEAHSISPQYNLESLPGPSLRLRPSAPTSAPTTKNTIEVGECLSTIKSGERILELIVSMDCAETLFDFNSIIQ